MAGEYASGIVANIDAGISSAQSSNSGANSTQAVAICGELLSARVTFA